MKYIHMQNTDDQVRPFGDLPIIKIHKHYFSAGECHVTVDSVDDIFDEDIIITYVGRSHNIMEIAQMCDILRRGNVRSIKLYLPYFYYSRQDRATTLESSFSLSLVCGILSQLGIDETITHDIHSGVSLDWNIPITNIEPVRFLSKVYLNGYDYIIAPDKGAQKKIWDLCALAGIPNEVVLVASKTRDPATGKLSDPNMDDESIQKLDKSRALIFDDICDGGYTFFQLGKYLKENVSVELDLAVTHGIFSKGTKTLLDVFDTIYTTDSMPSTYGTVRFKHEIKEEL